MNRKLFSLLFIGVTMGLAWAMRGHFGHEWGASWSGAIGVLSVLLISNRRDWNRKALVLIALSAIGWGAGGMMSYGLIVGYCRSTSFLNAFYGYTMLAVVGGLYGFIGGGLFGLGLESTSNKKTDWPRLVVEMFAGGFLVWGLLIYQMEWFMTPPRSELWAAMLGAGIALTWYLARNGYHQALRVAAYAALGAGFGFAFGNFIQTLGSASGISYNWWNVMEFTLGLFGGLGMAYAVLTRSWPESSIPQKTANIIAFGFVFLFIPLANFVNGMNIKHFVNLGESLHLANPHRYAAGQLAFAAGTLVVFFTLFVVVWKKWCRNEAMMMHTGIPALFFLTTLEYNIFAWIKLGSFYKSYSFRNSDALYPLIVVMLFVSWYFYFRKLPALPGENNLKETRNRWGVILTLLFMVLLFLALISVNSHGELPGAHNRF